MGENCVQRSMLVTLVRYVSDLHLDVRTSCQIADSIGFDGQVAALNGVSHVLPEAFSSYLGKGYRIKLIEYRIFDRHLVKLGFQRTTSNFFSSSDPFLLTELTINRLKGAETWVWISSRPALRRVIITNDLTMPYLVCVMANIIKMRPKIVSYLMEMGRTDNGDSLSVRSSFFFNFS